MANMAVRHWIRVGMKLGWQAQNRWKGTWPVLHNHNIMSSDGQDHPLKIYWTCLMCFVQSLLNLLVLGQATVMTSTCIPICGLTEAYNIDPSIQTSSHWDLEAPQTKATLYILGCNLYIMHDHLDLTIDLDSHLWTWQPTLALPCISLTYRQCQVPVHQPDSWQLIMAAHHSQLILTHMNSRSDTKVRHQSPSSGLLCL